MTEKKVILTLAALLLGCTEERPTEIVAAVASDLQIPAELDGLRLTVEHRGATQAQHFYILDPRRPAFHKLPATLGIMAGGDPSLPVTVTVEGSRAGSGVVQRRARLSFIERKILLLRMDLLRACAGRVTPCPTGKSCMEGGVCRSMEVDPRSLPEYDPGLVHGLDAGVSTLDGPPVDGPPVDGPPKTDAKGCGNGALDPGEPCDGAKLGGKTCLSLGHAGGALTCRADCTLDSSGCVKVLDKGDFPVTTAKGVQAAPEVASDGNDYLVVWHDERNGTRDIYGARVGANGKVVDSAGLAISKVSTAQSRPRVAFGKSSYLVVWYGFDSSSDWDIYGARVSPGGTVLDGTSIAITSAKHQQYYPAAASNGTDFFVVWADFRSGIYSDIYGTRVSAAGAVMKKDGVVISSATGNQSMPRLARGGSMYLVVWRDGRGTSRDIYAARVSSYDTVFDKAGIPVAVAAEVQDHPAVASDGVNQFLVVWDDKRSGKDLDIYGARVSANGSVLDPGGFPICKASGNQDFPAVTYTGQQYLVTWSDTSGSSATISGARISTGGKVLDSPPLVISSAGKQQRLSSVARIGTTSLVVWDDARNGANKDIYGTRVEPKKP